MKLKFEMTLVLELKLEMFETVWYSNVIFSYLKIFCNNWDFKVKEIKIGKNCNKKKVCDFNKFDRWRFWSL